MQVKGLSKFALFAAPKGDSTSLSNHSFKDLKAGNGDFTAEEQTLLEGGVVATVDAYMPTNSCGVDTPTLASGPVSSSLELRGRNKIAVLLTKRAVRRLYRNQLSLIVCPPFNLIDYALESL